MTIEQEEKDYGVKKVSLQDLMNEMDKDNSKETNNDNEDDEKPDWKDQFFGLSSENRLNTTLYTTIYQENTIFEGWQIGTLSNTRDISKKK